MNDFATNEQALLALLRQHTSLGNGKARKHIDGKRGASVRMVKQGETSQLAALSMSLHALHL